MDTYAYLYCEGAKRYLRLWNEKDMWEESVFDYDYVIDLINGKHVFRNKHTKQEYIERVED